MGLYGIPEGSGTTGHGVIPAYCGFCDVNSICALVHQVTLVCCKDLELLRGLQTALPCFEAKKKLLQQARILKDAFVITPEEPLPDDLVTALQVSCPWLVLLSGSFLYVVVLLFVRVLLCRVLFVMLP